MNRSAKLFENHRPHLLRVAYHMLGRLSEAEDIVQEAYLKWRKVDSRRINNASAYLSTIVSRLCLDKLKSAQYRREEYIGPDLPEPILTSTDNTPEENTQLTDSLSVAMMFLLEKLNPVQRAVFILREVFSYPYADIADTINKSETHCRKIAQRARAFMDEHSDRFKADREGHQKLLQSFMKAVKLEDLDQLESLLAKEATLYSDGGGQVTAARKPIFGPDNIARFMIGVADKAPTNVDVIFSMINGEPGLQIYFGDTLQSAWTVRIWDGQITEIYAVLNPEKLEHL